MGKVLELYRCLTIKVIEIVNKHMKKGWALLVIRKMKVTPTHTPEQLMLKRLTL